MHRQSFSLCPYLSFFRSLGSSCNGKCRSTARQTRPSLGAGLLPDNHGMLITLRGGELRHWQAGKGLSAPLSGVPDVWAHGQGGLLDVVLAPDFAQSRRIWLSYSEVGDDGKAGTAVGYGRLSDDLSKVTDFRTVFRQMPKLSTGNHFGGRMVFDGKGYLLLLWAKTISARRRRIWINYRGKLVRLTDLGEIPDDNPFIKESGVRAEIWSYGIRNPQGMAMNPWSNALWLNEHGPRGGDEINIPQKAKTTAGRWQPGGINYSGFKIPEAKGEIVAGTEQPVFTGKIRPP